MQGKKSSRPGPEKKTTTDLKLHIKTKSSMSSSLTFQDGQTALSRPHQEQNLLPQETSFNQRRTQNPNQQQDRNQDLEEREAGAHLNYPPDPPDEQQHPSPNSESSLTSDLDMNATHIQDVHLIIEFMFGTLEGQISETKND